MDMTIEGLQEATRRIAAFEIAVALIEQALENKGRRA